MKLEINIHLGVQSKNVPKNKQKNNDLELNH